MEAHIHEGKYSHICASHQRHIRNLRFRQRDRPSSDHPLNVLFGILLLWFRDHYALNNRNSKTTTPAAAFTTDRAALDDDLDLDQFESTGTSRTMASWLEQLPHQAHSSSVKDNAKRLESHEEILGLFAAILKNGKWSDDKVDDQQPPNSYDPDQDVESAGAAQEHTDDEVEAEPVPRLASSQGKRKRDVPRRAAAEKAQEKFSSKRLKSSR